MSTGPSETRKLPELPTPFGPWHATSDYDGYYAYTADQMHAYALEALAASEPVEVNAIVEAYRSGDRVEFTVDQFRHFVRSHITHPAPQQPGKGELEIAIKALRKIATEQSAVTPTEAADLFQRLARDALTDIGTSRIFTGAPQPSDPAEGDAVQCPCCGAPCALGEQFVSGLTGDEAGGEIVDTYTYLSTPPTAAVSVDEEMVGAPFGFVATTAARQLRDVDVCTIRKERSAAYSIPVYTTPQSVVSVDEAMVRFESAMSSYMEDHDAECLDPSEEFIRRVTMHGLTAALDPQVKKTEQD